jgi:hypothetical protein
VLLITKKLASVTKWNEILKVHNSKLRMGNTTAMKILADLNSSHEWRIFES